MAQEPQDTKPEKVVVVPAATPPTTPVVAVSDSGEGVAERYITRELKEAKSTRTRTIVLSLILLALVLGDLAYITIRVRQQLQPEVAAEITSGLISTQVDAQAQGVAEQMKQALPKLIEQLPDQALQAMPGYRQQLETQIDSDMQQHFDSAAQQLDANIDDFLTANKANIGDVLKTGKDPQAVHQLSAALQQDFVKSLSEVPVTNGETAKTKIDGALKALQEINKKMAHLAANQNLNPQEKKLRRAVAIMASKISHGVGEVKMGS